MNCKYLDHQLCIRSDGQYRFCCASIEPSNKENIKTHTPQEWFNSTTHRNARATFAKGEFPNGCETCKNKENLGLESMRTRPRLHGPGISHLDIRFGNSCNLKCISCWEMSSSSIAEEAIEMQKQGLIPVNNVIEVPNFNWASEEAIEQITKFPIQEVYLTGGEPMMVKHLPKLLERLDSDVTVRFNTNGTIYNNKLEKLLKRFKVVNMALSLDAIGDKIEYIRYGSKWNEILDNYKRYRNYCVLMSITPTISVLNAPYMQELVDWAAQEDLAIHLDNKLDNPKHLHVRNAPADLKKLFTHTEGWEVGEADPNQIEIFKDRITRLDNFRNIKIKDYLPEVANAYGLD